MTHITEQFKQFQKERIEEDRKKSKGRNFNYMQEVYSKTELFDISLLDRIFETKETSLNNNTSKDLKIVTSKYKSLVDISIPFESLFVKMDEEAYIFLHEFAPNIITGSAYLKSNNGNIYNIAFQIYTNSGEIHIENGLNLQSEYYKETLKDYNKRVVDLYLAINSYITNCISVICSLPKHSVVSDTPSNKTDYYRRKHAETIKVMNRPIYYVLEKEEETTKRTYNKIRACGKLEFTYSFKVRGHWRVINSKSYGKNRSGDYIVLGHTWVTDYIKGEGELAKRVRVVK